MAEYLSMPMSPLPDFHFNNVYATEHVMVFNASNLPTTKSSRNTLTIGGNIRVKGTVAIVPENFNGATSNDLFFNGNIYVSGDIIAELLKEYIPDLSSASVQL